MTDENIDTTDIELDEALKAAEFEALKERATKLGLKFHPNIGEEKLREKVKEFMEKEAAEEKEEKSVEEEPVAPKPETDAEFRRRKKKEAAALVRVRITCMNPNKREWEGEFFIAANSVVGTFAKYVPFNTEWHVPQIILNQIQQRKCQVFYTALDGRGNKIRKGKLVPEFSIEILPPLTKKELHDLAQRQAMANGTAED